MKRKKTRGLAVLIFGIIVTLGIGCEGSEGPTGPAGPVGPVGPAGPQGEQGPPGTANVVYSDWMTLGDVSSAADTSILGSNYARYHIEAESITQEVIDMGTVHVYYSLSDMITALPFSVAQSGGLVLHITFATLQPGWLTILSQWSNNTTANLNTSTQFRYIIIPGGMAAKEKYPDFSNYYETIEFYGIEE